MSSLKSYFINGDLSKSSLRTSKPKVKCPVCTEEVKNGSINEHLDLCLAQEQQKIAGGDSSLLDTPGNMSCCSNSEINDLDQELSRCRGSLNPFRQRCCCQTNREKRFVKPRNTQTDLSVSGNIEGFNKLSPSSNDSKFRDAECSGSDATNDFVARADNSDGLRHSFDSSTELQDGELKEIQDPYYLSNFIFIIQTVLLGTQNFKLFNEEDHRNVAIFKNLKKESQLLYVRLFLRKSGWFKCEMLSYPHISMDLSLLLSELVDNGLLVNEEHLTDLKEILNLLSASEVRSLAQSLQLLTDGKGKKLSCKMDYVTAIFNYTNNQQSILSFTIMKKQSNSSIESHVICSAKKYLGKCVKLAKEIRDLFSRFFHFFMLMNYPSSINDDNNSNQSLIYKLLLVNKGEITFPSYQISEATEIFPSRQAFIRYSDALSLEEELSGLLEKQNFSVSLHIYEIAKNELQNICSSLSKISEPEKQKVSTLPQLRRFSAEWVYTRICGKSVEVLEKQGMHKEAVELLRLLLSQRLYCVSSRGLYWERLTIDTERYLKDTVAALDFIKCALSDPFVRTGKRLGLITRATRICKSKKFQILKARMVEMKSEKMNDIKEVTISASLYLDTSSSQRAVFVSCESTDNEQGLDTKLFTDVEQCALIHYSNIGYPKGVHAEGSCYTLIFSLLFWDIIFMDVPDVFVGPYQACPLDFFTDGFYESRKKQIDSKLAEIHSSSTKDLRKLVHDSWTAHYGQTCAGVNWKVFATLQDIMEVVSCLQSCAVTGVCELLCKDFKNRCSGMPDLFVWNPSNGLCKAIEVKGPGDRLSHKQIIWLNILSSLGVDSEACYVKEQQNPHGKTGQWLTEFEEYDYTVQ